MTGRPIQPEDLTIRSMTEPEVHELLSWALEEGWNPGVNDARLFWQNDPQGFIAAEAGGEVVGGGAITAYGDAYGFMGLFIMRPAYRGQGLGRRLWNERVARLRARLAPDASIGMDGVEAMEPFYARGGFVKSHQNRRYQFTGRRLPQSSRIAPAGAVDLAALAAFDRQHFPAPRASFLKAWLSQPGGCSLVCLDDAAAGADRNTARITGLGVMRPCAEGYKIGPLFAEDAEIADELLCALQGEAVSEPVFLDVPDLNPAAQAIVVRHEMQEVFSCARMYLGDPPDVNEEQVFGITTFELG